MKKKIILRIAIACLLIIIFSISPYSKLVLSWGVMKVYSQLHESRSIMAEKGFFIDIPGGTVTKEKDWYPFVMTYCPSQSSFQNWIGDSQYNLTIIYNFPAFDLRWGKGCSSLFDSTSIYYNSFYGAYVVEGTNPNYGFDSDGTLDIQKIGLVPQYDFQRLVLSDFGLKQEEMIFQWQPTEVEKDLWLAGYDGWTVVNADLLVNSVAHKSKGFVRTYLQYGMPKYDLRGHQEFEKIQMKGRIYGKYFEQWNCSIFFYILSGDMEVLENCDHQIIKKSKLYER